MTRAEAENLLHDYLKRYNKHYKKIEKIIFGETNLYFLFLCKYKANTVSCKYAVIKETGDVWLVPT